MPLSWKWNCFRFVFLRNWFHRSTALLLEMFWGTQRYQILEPKTRRVHRTQIVTSPSSSLNIYLWYKTLRCFGQSTTLSSYSHSKVCRMRTSWPHQNGNGNHRWSERLQKLDWKSGREAIEIMRFITSPCRFKWPERIRQIGRRW